MTKKLHKVSFRYDEGTLDIRKKLFSMIRKKCGKYFTDSEISRALWKVIAHDKKSVAYLLRVVCHILDHKV